MKKLLLLLLTFSLGLNAQVLSYDDHSQLTIGNIGTDITGIVPGQDGYLTSFSNNIPSATNSVFQIVDKGLNFGNSIQIIGPENNLGNRFLTKSGFQSLWSTRDSGKDIIEVEFDIFTGDATTSRNNIRILLYTDETTPRILAGISFAKNITYRTGTTPNFVASDFSNLIIGYSFNNSTPESARIYYGTFYNSPTPQVLINNNSWFKFGFSYNKLTGQTKWKGAGIDGITNAAASALALNLVPSKLVVQVFTGNSGQITDGGTPPIVIVPAIQNAASATFAIDNIKISATSVDNLLGVDSLDLRDDSFTIFPNPANRIINISNTENVTINKISITDLNGRIVKAENFVNISNIEVNVSDLNNGLYFMNIYSENGLTTKKIIKN